MSVVRECRAERERAVVLLGLFTLFKHCQTVSIMETGSRRHPQPCLRFLPQSRHNSGLREKYRGPTSFSRSTRAWMTIRRFLPRVKRIYAGIAYGIHFQRQGIGVRD